MTNKDYKLTKGRREGSYHLWEKSPYSKSGWAICSGNMDYAVLVRTYGGLVPTEVSSSEGL